VIDVPNYVDLLFALPNLNGMVHLNVFQFVSSYLLPECVINPDN